MKGTYRAFIKIEEKGYRGCLSMEVSLGSALKDDEESALQKCRVRGQSV